MRCMRVGDRAVPGMGNEGGKCVFAVPCIVCCLVLCLVAANDLI